MTQEPTLYDALAAAAQCNLDALTAEICKATDAADRLATTLDNQEN